MGIKERNMYITASQDKSQHDKQMMCVCVCVNGKQLQCSGPKGYNKNTRKISQCNYKAKCCRSHSAPYILQLYYQEMTKKL